MVALVVVVVAVVVASSSSGQHSATAAGRHGPLAQLPRGGRTIFPHFRVVAYYGAPQAASLGTLGIGTPEQAARRLEHTAHLYKLAMGRPVLPALELLADIADRDPGRDGMYRTIQPDAVIARYLAVARRHHDLLLLDIQPGRGDFLLESEQLERWLRLPDVSLALDPEWHVAAPGVPGDVIGSVDAEELNAVSFWLDRLTARHHLPQKLLLIHRFTEGEIKHFSRLKTRRHLAITLNIDGVGDQAVKIAKYRSFMHEQRGRGFRHGFKLFFREDTQTMTPSEVAHLVPAPDVVDYE